MQVSDGARHVLVDPLALEDLSPLLAVLAEPGVEKVLHAAGEDLECLRVLGAAPPQPLFDTQIAAAFAGLGFGLGYRTLLARALAVEIPKDETRSDWLRRPLSAAQLRYAVLDVAWLPALREWLGDRLAERGFEPWFREECARCAARAREEPDPEAMWTRVRGGGRLDGTGRTLLRALAAWREREARARDRPRGHVVPDAALVALARRPPCTPQDVAAAEGMRPREARRSAAAILRAVAGARDTPASRQPEAPPASMDPRDHAATMDRLKGAVRERARALDIPPALLAHRGALEALVHHRRVSRRAGLPEPLAGWRAEAIGDSLAEIVDADG